MHLFAAFNTRTGQVYGQCYRRKRQKEFIPFLEYLDRKIPARITLIHARGRRKQREPGRGHDDKDRPVIIAWGSRQGAVVSQASKDCTVQTVQTAAEIAVHPGSRL